MERPDRCLSRQLIFSLVTSPICFLTTPTTCEMTKEFGSIINPPIAFVTRSHCDIDIHRWDGQTHTHAHAHLSADTQSEVSEIKGRLRPEPIGRGSFDTGAAAQSAVEQRRLR